MAVYPPKGLTQLVTAALENRRHFRVEHGEDIGGHPFTSVEVVCHPADARPARVNATWHTRDSGTYRLFSLIASYPSSTVQWNDLTLTRALHLIQAGDLHG